MAGDSAALYCRDESTPRSMAGWGAFVSGNTAILRSRSRAALLQASGSVRIGAEGCSARSLARTRGAFDALFAMGPHADDFHGVLVFQNLIDQPMLDVDSTGVGSRQIADELFAGWRIRERVLGEDFQHRLRFLFQTRGRYFSSRQSKTVGDSKGGRVHGGRPDWPSASLRPTLYGGASRRRRRDEARSHRWGPSSTRPRRGTAASRKNGG